MNDDLPHRHDDEEFDLGEVAGGIVGLALYILIIWFFWGMNH